MVQKPPCEKNSCQDLEYKILLADKSDFCEPCKELSGMTTSYIRRLQRPYKGVCHRLHPPPPPQDAAEGTAPGYESPIRIATRRRRMDTGGMSEATATSEFETPRRRLLRERDSANDVMNGTEFHQRYHPIEQEEEERVFHQVLIASLPDPRGRRQSVSSSPPPCLFPIFVSRY